MSSDDPLTTAGSTRVDCHRRIGILTPSSNTVLEPITNEMTRAFENVSVHFSRLRVTEIALNHAAIAQFDIKPFTDAASLLSDAQCDVIAWSGTSGGWRGLDYDQELCDEIHQRFGVKVTTSVLAQRDLFNANGVKTYGLLTPYTADVQKKIIDNFSSEGFDCVAERHLGITDNYSFATVKRSTLKTLCEELSKDGAKAISILCTNIRGADLAPILETELDIVLYDSVSVVVFRSLQLAGVTPKLNGWGKLFQSL